MSNDLVSQQDDGLTSGRLPVEQGVLETMATAVIKDNVTQKIHFTAWEVTKELQADNPTLEIIHDRVRPFVHDHMEVMCGVYNYGDEWVDYNGIQARTWMPITALSAPQWQVDTQVDIQVMPDDGNQLVIPMFIEINDPFNGADDDD